MTATATPTASGATFRTHDPEVALAWVGQAYGDSGAAMVPRGSQTGFAMTNTTHTRGPLTVVRADFSTGLSWHLEGGVGGLALTNPTRGTVQGRLSGRSTGAGVGEPFLQAEPHQPYAISWDAPIGVAVLLVQPEQFSDLVDQFVPDRTGLPRFTGSAPRSAAMSRYCAEVIDLASDEATEVLGSESGLLSDSFARFVAAAVLAAFPHTTTEPVRDHGDISSRPVRDAVEYIEAHADQAIGLAEIAAGTGFGARALQLAFRRHLDTTPTAYLRRVRLDRAHQDLARGNRAAGDSVSTIANRWGFGNLGRFAATYRRAYGREPRATLDRSG